MRSAPLPTMRFKHKSPRGAGEHVVPTWWELGRPLWGGPEVSEKRESHHALYKNDSYNSLNIAASD